MNFCDPRKLTSWYADIQLQGLRNDKNTPWRLRLGVHALALISSLELVGCRSKSKEELALDRLESFAKQLERKATERAADLVESVDDIKYDMKRTDSVRTPYEAHIVIELSRPMEREGRSLIVVTALEADYVYEVDEWKCESITSRLLRFKYASDGPKGWLELGGEEDLLYSMHDDELKESFNKDTGPINKLLVSCD